MNKEEALKIIKERLIVDYSKLNEKEVQELDDALDMAFDSLKGSDGWIPVSTGEFPKVHSMTFDSTPYYESDECLITISDSSGLSVGTGVYVRDTSEGWEWSDGGHVDGVIAWKPLPEPYKG